MKQYTMKSHLVILLLCNITFFAQKSPADHRPDSVLIKLLDDVYLDDQSARREWVAAGKKNGFESKEYKELGAVVHLKDSVNQLKVQQILDIYGWLGADVIGEQGNKTLFLVVQHAGQQFQEKYLPVMEAAVKAGKAKASSFALLKDRVLLGQGKMQLYGSQLLTEGGKQYVEPIEDVDHVDERRSTLGLAPMSEYLKNWNLVWDLEQYKKEQPDSPAYKRLLAYREWLKLQGK